MISSKLIYFIWVSDNDKWDDVWLLSAWDAHTREKNYNGWVSVLDEAKRRYRRVEVITLRIDVTLLKEKFQLWSDEENPDKIRDI